MRRTPARRRRRGGRANRTPRSWVSVLRTGDCAWPPLTAAGRKYLFVRQVPAAKVSESSHAPRNLLTLQGDTVRATQAALAKEFYDIAEEWDPAT